MGKLILCFVLVLIPISTQTDSHIIYSENWSLKEEIAIMRIKIKVVEAEIKFYRQKKDLRIADMVLKLYDSLRVSP